MIAVAKIVSVGAGTIGGAAIAVAAHLVAVTDSVWLVLIPAMSGLVVVAMQLWASSRTAKALRDAEKIAKSSHTLLNHDRGVLLDSVAEKSRTIQELSPNPENLATAVRDERAALAHHAAQLIVDAQPGTDAEKGGAKKT